MEQGYSGMLCFYTFLHYKTKKIEVRVPIFTQMKNLRHPGLAVISSQKGSKVRVTWLENESEAA